MYFQVRLEEASQCIVAIIGAEEGGRKELLALWDGYRESAESWKEVLLDLKGRGLQEGPKLAVGDGALGFWKALRQVYGQAREQRCWAWLRLCVHKKIVFPLSAATSRIIPSTWRDASGSRPEVGSSRKITCGS